VAGVEDEAMAKIEVGAEVAAAVVVDAVVEHNPGMRTTKKIRKTKRYPSSLSEGGCKNIMAGLSHAWRRRIWLYSGRGKRAEISCRSIDLYFAPSGGK
jgi:hypothetical protein